MQGLAKKIRHTALYRALHLRYTGWRARLFGLPDWKRILSRANSDGAPPSRTDGGPRRVLIATGTAGHLPSMTLESLLGVTLSRRQAEVEFLLCDGSLPACMMCEVGWYSDLESFAVRGPTDRCPHCYEPAAEMLKAAGIPFRSLGELCNEFERRQAAETARTVDRTELGGYQIDGVNVGEHAMAGALRFFARGELEESDQAGAVLRRYFEAALLSYFAVRRMVLEGGYDVVVLNHGIYVPQGVIAQTARRYGVRVVTWHTAYRRGCFIFNHDETYHQGLLNEPVACWKNMRWGTSQRAEIQAYLQSRQIGNQDWIRFHRDPEFGIEEIESEVGIDLSRPTIGLLTNVVWDAQLHYKSNAFSGMLEWLRKTIEYFAERKDLQLLIRVHPAEITGTVPSRQRVTDEILKWLPSLPGNVYLIPPESRLSTYAAMARCNAVLIYGTKMGVELSAVGIPVIVAGEAWIRGKGLTYDASSEADYLRLLGRLPFSPDGIELCTENALKYAYHFFFRRMIPLNCVEERKGWPPFKVAVRSVSELARGRSKGLDIVCDGILNGAPFIYPAEDLGGTDAL